MFINIEIISHAGIRTTELRDLRNDIMSKREHLNSLTQSDIDYSNFSVSKDQEISQLIIEIDTIQKDYIILYKLLYNEEPNIEFIVNKSYNPYTDYKITARTA